MELINVFTSIANAVHTHKDTAGVIWVKNDECFFCPIDDIKDQQSREIIREHYDKPIFFVIYEIESVAHVYTYPKEYVYNELKKHLQSQSGEGDKEARSLEDHSETQ